MPAACCMSRSVKKPSIATGTARRRFCTIPSGHRAARATQDGSSGTLASAMR